MEYSNWGTAAHDADVAKKRVYDPSDKGDISVRPGTSPQGNRKSLGSGKLGSFGAVALRKRRGR